MAAIFHVAFFCQLQSSLLILVFFVVVFFYWVNKFKVLRTCKIPEMTQFLVFETALAQATLIPVVYGVGSIVISYIRNRYDLSLSTNNVPSLIQIGLGVLGFFNPGDFINISVEWVVQKFRETFSKNKMFEQNSSQVNSTQKVFDKNVVIKNETVNTNRIDSYFKNTNYLPLIGFEYVLAGGEYNNFPSVTVGEIDRFCQKCLLNEHENKTIYKKINKTAATKTSNGLKKNEASLNKLQNYTKKEKENYNLDNNTKRALNGKLTQLNNEQKVFSKAQK